MAEYGVLEVDRVTGVSTQPLTAKVKRVTVYNLSESDYHQTAVTYDAFVKARMTPDYIIRDVLIKNLGYPSSEDQFESAFPEGDPNHTGGVKIEPNAISSYQIKNIEHLLADPNHSNGLVLATQALSETDQADSKMIELTVILKKPQEVIEPQVDTSQLLG